MFQMMNQPWISFHDHADIVEKYNKVCHVVHELASIIKQLEHKIGEIGKKQETEQIKVPKRCKFFNKGYCKQGERCSFVHPSKICPQHLESGKCIDFRSCLDRHPQECRFWKETTCYRGGTCLYLHKKVADKEEEKSKNEGKSTMMQLENDDFVDEVNGEMIMEDIYDMTDETDDKTDEILVNHDEIVEEMSVEDIIKFYEDDKNLFKPEDLDYYCDIKQVECVSKPPELMKTKRTNIEAQKGVLEKSTKKKGAKP